VIFISNGLHLVLSISATIGSKRNYWWVVALLLGLVEDRNRRTDHFLSCLMVFICFKQNPRLYVLCMKIRPNIVGHRESSGAFWGFSRLLIPSRGSAPLIILKMRDLGTVIPKTGIRKHNEYVIWGWFGVKDEQSRFLQESRFTAQRIRLYFCMQKGHKALHALWCI
jgi:hypothetical protein